MEVQVNPGIENLKILLWVMIPLLTVLVSGIGTLTVIFLKRQTTAFDKMADAIDNLKTAFATLKAVVDTSNPLVTRRLNIHSSILDKHEGRIKVLETEHRMIHRRCNINTVQEDGTGEIKEQENEEEN